jgi:DNA-binding SARP family transcriptional activator/tetratricopeptide (TPR) repeat protein
VRFRILGPVEVQADQGWASISAPKWRALLAVLLVQPGQPVSADRLMAELWGDKIPGSAPNLLSVYALRLRRLIGDTDSSILITRAPGYELRLPPGVVDAREFESLVSQGRDAVDLSGPQAAAAVLSEALSLWRGSPLADVPPSPLVTAEIGRLEELRLTALELRAAAHLDLGRHAQVVPELRRLTADHPLREELWALLMRALDGAGRHAEAVAAYGAAREVIAAELGVDPGAELRRLYQSMLRDDPPARRPASTQPERSASRAAPAGAAPGSAPAEPALAPEDESAQPEPTPVTSARAESVSAEPGKPGPAAVPAELAGNISAGAIPADAGPDQPRPGPFPGGGLPVPAQLPADVADFAGRGDHMRELTGLLADASVQVNPAAVTVVVVAGSGGLGKTTLVVHAAHALRPSFPEGQLFVSLLGASQQPLPPDEVLARLLRDLGVPAGRIPVGQEERATLYRSTLAGRRVLVVLDDARDAAQIRPLLPGTSSSAVIATSRQRLPELAGSHLLDLNVLDEDAARLLFTRIIGEARAGAEPGPVRDVLAACAGLPLAIRIAGARLRARRGWSVATLASRLVDQRHRMDELTAGDLAVRACFQVSYDALARSTRAGDVDPAKLFRLLGVWQGPTIGLSAAAALTGWPEAQVAVGLEILTDANLLESPAPDVYQLHDLLRAYAAERAVAEEDPAARADSVRRLLTWYLHTADAAGSVLSPHRMPVPLGAPEPEAVPESFGNADEALAWSGREQSNLVAATRQAASQQLHEIAWKLPVAAMISFELHGYRAEWLTTHRIALDSAREQGDRSGEARVLNNLGMVLGEQRADDAVGYFEQSLAIYRELGDPRGTAQVMNNLAFSYRFLGRPRDAVALLLTSLDLQREVGARRGEVIALCNLGESYLELGDFDQAIRRSEQALAVAREIRAERLAGYAQYNLGRVRLEQGSTAEAVGLLSEALEIHRGSGDKYGEAQDLQQIGLAHRRAGEPSEARGAWTQARSIFEILGDQKQVEELRSHLHELGAGLVQA